MYTVQQPGVVCIYKQTFSKLIQYHSDSLAMLCSEYVVEKCRLTTSWIKQKQQQQQ